MKIEKDILELEVYSKRLILYTGTEDYTLAIDKIEKIALKDDAGFINIYLKLKPNMISDCEWPEALTRSEFLKIPEVFDAASIDIISENESLSHLCVNLAEFRD